MIDLHTHTDRSDGTDSPTQLLEAARVAEVSTLAITDHDTTAGWDEAQAAADRLGITLVRGAEVSTRHRGISVHLLAYLFDPDEPVLREALDAVRDDRTPRLRTIVERFADDGFDLTWADVEAEIAEGASPGRPHVADALVRKGYAPHRNDVFARWLHNGSRYYVPHHTIDTADAIALVRGAGGVPVLAHPFAASRGWVISADDVRQLAGAGLVGIEVAHRDHDPDEVALAASLADELDLVPTGSSDYHGDGKLNRLGENATSPESLARIEEAATGTIVRR